jgi:hypothetical protein
VEHLVCKLSTGEVATGPDPSCYQVSSSQDTAHLH